MTVLILRDYLDEQGWLRWVRAALLAATFVMISIGVAQFQGLSGSLACSLHCGLLNLKTPVLEIYPLPSPVTKPGQTSWHQSRDSARMELAFNLVFLLGPATIGTLALLCPSFIPGGKTKFFLDGIFSEPFPRPPHLAKAHLVCGIVPTSVLLFLSSVVSFRNQDHELFKAGYQENTWTYGQLLPMFLLVVPILNCAVAIQG
jgi:hypothetical protein